MTSGQGRAKGEFASEGGRTDNASETTGVVAGVGGVGAAHAEEIEHGGLWLQDGATAEGADFEGGHGDADLEVSRVGFGVESTGVSMRSNTGVVVGLLLHGGDTVS